MKVVLAVFLASMMTMSCSSTPTTNQESQGDAAAGTGSTAPISAVAQSGPSPTLELILEKYTLSDLDGAANALKVIADQSKAAKDDKQGEAVIGCTLTGADAQKQMAALKDVIEASTPKEREQYLADSKVYARDRGFETCGSNCTCDVYAQVLKGVSAKSLKAGAKPTHDKQLVRLQGKAARQGPEATLACAKKANWYCGSDLQVYLQGQSR